MSDDNKSPAQSIVQATTENASREALEHPIPNFPSIPDIKFADPHLLSFIYAHGFIFCILALVFSILYGMETMIMVIINFIITTTLSIAFVIVEYKKKKPAIHLRTSPDEDRPLFLQNRVILAEFGLTVLWFIAAGISIPTRGWYGLQVEGSLAATFGFLATYVFFINALLGIRLRVKELETRLDAAEAASEQIRV